MLDCTASIVAYENPPEMLRAAAESFLSCSLKVRLFIVDNSPEQGLKNVFNGLPVEYYFYGKNIGYGKAHNYAIENSAESRYHLIMNPDIVIMKGTIERMASFMDENHDVGIVCPRVLNTDGTDQCLNKRYLNVTDLFVRRFVPNFFQPLLKRRMDHYEMRDVGYDKICDVECIPGAFMLCRKSVLKALGGFDPRYFMYFEDGDLCLKFQQNHYRTIYYPNATVIHGYERASHKNVRMTAVFIANMLRYFNKWGWKWL
jgi:GT2 family glycosyltransferase